MANTIEVGDVVKLSEGASFYTGSIIVPWIKNKLWVVKSISGTRVVLGGSADGRYTLNAPVDMKYLEKIEF